MHSLPVFLRLSSEAVLVLGEGDAADAKKRLVERAGGKVTDDPLAPVRFAFIATDDPEEAEAVAAVLKARGLFINVADRPDLCDFTLPAIVDRDPVIIAIGTGGASAGLAKALRQRIETLLPNNLGMLAQKLYNSRAVIKTRWASADDRRRAIDAGLGEGGVIDPLRNDATERFDHWLGGDVTVEGGIHHIVITSDDPDDLTLRTVRLLGQADEIWYDPAIALVLLHRGRADAKRVASKTPPPGDAATGDKLIIWLTLI